MNETSKSGGRFSTSYPRNTPGNSHNSLSRRENILKQIAANKDASGQVYLGSNNSSVVGRDALERIRTTSSRVSSQQNSSMRRMIQTATEQFNQRQKVRNSRIQQGSRLSTADNGKPPGIQSPEEFYCPNNGIQVMDQLKLQAASLASPNRDKDLDQQLRINGFVEYPVPPTQPMLTDRSSNNRDNNRDRNVKSNVLPYNLQQSPECDEIICFAALQSSPKENILHQQNRRQTNNPAEIDLKKKAMTLNSMFSSGSDTENQN